MQSSRGAAARRPAVRGLACGLSSDAGTGAVAARAGCRWRRRSRGPGVPGGPARRAARGSRGRRRGSGRRTAAGVRTLLIRVTAPLRASMRPTTVAPLFSEMLVSAIRLPWNAVVVPSVAELPTCQKTLHGVAPLMSTTELADAVVSADADLEDELRVGVALGVERERAGELRGRGVPVGARGQRPVAEVGARQVVGGRDRLPGRDVVGRGEVVLRLAGDGVGGVRGAVDHGGQAEAGERGARVDPELAVEHRRAGVRDGGAGEDDERPGGAEIHRGGLRGSRGGEREGHGEGDPASPPRLRWVGLDMDVLPYGEQPDNVPWPPPIADRAIGVVAVLRQPGELRWSPVALRTRLATRVPESRRSAPVFGLRRHPRCRAFRGERPVSQRLLCAVFSPVGMTCKYSTSQSLRSDSCDVRRCRLARPSWL